MGKPPKAIVKICKMLAERDAAQERVRELEAENERLREQVSALTACYGPTLQDAYDLASGRDLRCLMECGLEWYKVGDGKHPWSVRTDMRGWLSFATLAEAAAAVREWQAAQKVADEPAPLTDTDKAQVGGDPYAPLRDGLAGVWVGDPPVQVFPAPTAEPRTCPCGYCAYAADGDLCWRHWREDGGWDECLSHCPRCGARLMDEPAPTPEDAARARIAAAGAELFEGVYCKRVTAADGRWFEHRHTSEDWGRFAVVALEELAAFAEAHRAPQDEPAPSPEDAARARIAAAGATLRERLCRVHGAGAWEVTGQDGVSWSFKACYDQPTSPPYYDRAAAFAEAHRAPQDTGGDK